jgi:hypothetical protein
MNRGSVEYSRVTGKAAAKGASSPIRKQSKGEIVVGAFIMLGSLFGLSILIIGLVLRFDPEARGPLKSKGSL